MLEVNLLGKKFKNPVIAASGTFGYGYEFEKFFSPSKLGGISLKALTVAPTLGNATPRIAETPSGMLNSVGLQNVGVKEFKLNILPNIRKYDTVLIANIAGKTESDYLSVIEELNETSIDMYELNISCPNVSHGGLAFGANPKIAKDITQKAKAVAQKPLIVKLTPNVTNVCEIALAVQDGGADAVSLINTFLGMSVNIKTRKPTLANNTGGLSGACVKPLALRMVRDVYKAVTIPVIGMGGICSAQDVLEFMLCGASAVMVGTANITNPYACPEIIAQLETYLIDNGIKNINEIVGKLEEN